MIDSGSSSSSSSGSRRNTNANSNVNNECLLINTPHSFLFFELKIQYHCALFMAKIQYIYEINKYTIVY